MCIRDRFKFFISKEDPSLERHFKGHRDAVTCIDFNPNMKQLGIIFYEEYFYLNYMRYHNLKFP